MARAYKTRATLINVYGKELLAKLGKEFPEIVWAITYRYTKPTVVGVMKTESGAYEPVVWGDTYELIRDNLAVLYKR